MTVEHPPGATTAPSGAHHWVTRDIERAAAALLDGHLVAVPTETVYGLAGLVGVPHAVERIFTVKDRPSGHPLIVHIADVAAMDSWACDIPPYARAVATEFWPGPLTLVLPRGARVPDAVTGGRPGVALRVPAHPMLHELLRALDAADPSGAPHGVAAPSANRHGRVSPTTALHVVDDLADHLVDGDLVIDGGTCAIGVESTIVDCTGPSPVLLRPGGIGAADIADVVGTTVTLGPEVAPVERAWPGGLAAHYAPQARVILTTVEGLPDQCTVSGGLGLIAPGRVPTPSGVLRLAAPVDDAAYAGVLYAALREADRHALTTVLAVAPEETTALAAAVRDRLQRAASAQ